MDPYRQQLAETFDKTKIVGTELMATYWIDNIKSFGDKTHASFLFDLRSDVVPIKLFAQVIHKPLTCSSSLFPVGTAMQAKIDPKAKEEMCDQLEFISASILGDLSISLKEFGGCNPAC